MREIACNNTGTTELAAMLALMQEKMLDESKAQNLTGALTPLPDAQGLDSVTLNNSSLGIVEFTVNGGATNFLAVNAIITVYVRNASDITVKGNEGEILSYVVTTKV